MHYQKILPPTFFFIAVVLMPVLHFVFPLSRYIPWPWNITAILPIAAGLILNLLADKALKIHQTTVRPFQESTALVTNGVFCLSRNPMYLGMVLILTGLALFLGSITPWLIVILFVIVIKNIFIKAEEARLEQKFRPLWEIYKQKVPRWI